jgi:hypothetical protein
VNGAASLPTADFHGAAAGIAAAKFFAAPLFFP